MTLKLAKSIKNSTLCLYDSTDGFSSSFNTNGDVDGWDVYHDVFLYGSWTGMLFGSAISEECYIGRSSNFSYIECEDYYVIQIRMKITNNASMSGGWSWTTQELTTGRVRWTTLADSVWDSDKQVDFDLIDDNAWHVYTINMGPSKEWVGYVNNIRIYPFVGARNRDKFAISYVKITSSSQWRCLNTSCSYYSSYAHPCAGAGSAAIIESGSAKDKYTLVAGVSDSFIVNIDGYGNMRFNLGNCFSYSGEEIVSILSKNISNFNVGGYAYVSVELSDIYNRIKLGSGTLGSDSSISIVDTQAARELGFYDTEGVNVSTTSYGVDPADGFDYTFSRRLMGFEIAQVVDGSINAVAYEHSPEQYSVEGGRSDYAMACLGELTSKFDGNTGNINFTHNCSNVDKTLIDVTHPINSNGKIKVIYINGEVPDVSYKSNLDSKVIICRPRLDGTFKVIHSLNISTQDALQDYTSVTYRVDCNIIVSRGDVIGVYNLELYTDRNDSGHPNASFYHIDGEATGTFDPGDFYDAGASGFLIYARGTRRRQIVSLDIDMGGRYNVENVNVYGRKPGAKVEYNVSRCLDVNWNVDLYESFHAHRRFGGVTYYNVYHDNIAYGIEALNDGILTNDNGMEGLSIVTGDDGKFTTGTHTYFYVNGDDEWCDFGQGECGAFGEKVYDTSVYDSNTFYRDPISIYAVFSDRYDVAIHKSVIYFKDSGNNFFNIELSHYLGPYSGGGNAYSDDRFERVAYTKVLLDGASAQSLFYDNPSEREDGSSFRTMTHEFDPVVCKGFRVYSDSHESTKICEIELYSSFSMGSSLEDCVLVTASEYGDVWQSFVFEPSSDENNKIVTSIYNAPRYFTLTLDSNSIFELAMIELIEGEQVKLPACGDDLLLIDSGIDVNASTSLTFENVYDSKFDLIAGIPKDLYDTNELIFWNKLGTYLDLSASEVGPACKLTERHIFELNDKAAMCVKNCPGYILKNLVGGSVGYHFTNETSWKEWGVLSDDTELDYGNLGSFRKNSIHFNRMYGRYFAVHSYDPESYGGNVKCVKALYEDAEIQINTIYIETYLSDGAVSNRIPVETDDNNALLPIALNISSDVFSYDNYSRMLDVKMFHMTSCSGAGWSFFLVTDVFPGSYTDVEKSPENDDDDYLCWASAVSNMLVWTGWGQAYSTSSTAADDIFEYFGQHWTDEGGYVYKGIQWWFDGYDYPGSTGSIVDVFGGGAFYPSEDYLNYFHEERTPSLAMDAIVSYLTSGYGVGLGIYLAGYTSGHALTCWGYDYNELGEYVGLWVTDSDDSKESLYPDDTLVYAPLEYSGGFWWIDLESSGVAFHYFIGAVHGLERMPGAIFEQTGCDDENSYYYHDYEEHLIENTSNRWVDYVHYPSGIDYVLPEDAPTVVFDDLFYSFEVSIEGLTDKSAVVFYDANDVVVLAITPKYWHQKRSTQPSSSSSEPDRYEMEWLYDPSEGAIISSFDEADVPPSYLKQIRVSTSLTSLVDGVLLYRGGYSYYNSTDPTIDANSINCGNSTGRVRTTMGGEEYHCANIKVKKEHDKVFVTVYDENGEKYKTYFEVIGDNRPVCKMSGCCVSSIQVDVLPVITPSAMFCFEFDSSVLVDEIVLYSASLGSVAVFSSESALTEYSCVGSTSLYSGNLAASGFLRPTFCQDDYSYWIEADSTQVYPYMDYTRVYNSVTNEYDYTFFEQPLFCRPQYAFSLGSTRDYSNWNYRNNHTSTRIRWVSDDEYPHWISYDFGENNAKKIGKVIVIFDTIEAIYANDYDTYDVLPRDGWGHISYESIINNTEIHPGGVPNNLYIQGSNTVTGTIDQKEWTTLHYTTDVDECTYSWVVQTNRFDEVENVYTFENNTYYRFIRLYMTEPKVDSEFHVCITNIELFEEYIGPGYALDVAVNKPVKASTEATGGLAQKACDNNHGTGWTTSSGVEQWWKIDLEKEVHIVSVNVFMSDHDYAYTIYGSNSITDWDGDVGSNWEEVVVGADGDHTDTLHDDIDKTYQYLKIVVTSSSQIDEIVTLYSFEVYEYNLYLSEGTYNDYFAVDLGHRYDIGLLYNYGGNAVMNYRATGIYITDWELNYSGGIGFWTLADVNNDSWCVTYSSTDTDNIGDVVWGDPSSFFDDFSDGYLTDWEVTSSSGVEGSYLIELGGEVKVYDYGSVTCCSGVTCSGFNYGPSMTYTFSDLTANFDLEATFNMSNSSAFSGAYIVEFLREEDPIVKLHIYSTGSDVFEYLYDSHGYVTWSGSGAVFTGSSNTLQLGRYVFNEALVYTLNGNNRYVGSVDIDAINKLKISYFRCYGEVPPDNHSTEQLLLSAVTESTDARWLRFTLENAPLTTERYKGRTYYNGGIGKKLQRLGIYPNINTVYAPGGGYNCEWDSIGTELTRSYGAFESNLAYRGVTSTNCYIFSDSDSASVVDGVTDGTLGGGWAFDVVNWDDIKGDSTDAYPYIILDLGVERSIEHIVLYFNGEHLSSTLLEYVRGNQFVNYKRRGSYPSEMYHATIAGDAVRSKIDGGWGYETYLYTENVAFDVYSFPGEGYPYTSPYYFEVSTSVSGSDWEYVYLTEANEGVYTYDYASSNFVRVGQVNFVNWDIEVLGSEDGTYYGFDLKVTHHLALPMNALRVRITFTEWGDSPSTHYSNHYLSESLKFNGGRIYEAEVLTSEEYGRHYDSLKYPILSFDLVYPFDIAYTEGTFNAIEAIPSYTYTNAFGAKMTEPATYRYHPKTERIDSIKSSSQQVDNPQKVSFLADDDVRVYTNYNSSGVLTDEDDGYEYTFDDSVYLDVGKYRVNFDLYNIESADDAHLMFSGNVDVSCYPSISGTLSGTGIWLSFDEIVDVEAAGYYLVKGELAMPYGVGFEESVTYNGEWGIRNVIVDRATSTLKRWICVNNPFVSDYRPPYSRSEFFGYTLYTKYNWWRVSGEYDVRQVGGVPYNYDGSIDCVIRGYSNTAFVLTEHALWWESLIGTLSDDFMNTYGGVSSLRVDYPENFTKTDRVIYFGDQIGQDKEWDIRDSIRFWLYISDIDKLDIESLFLDFGIEIAYYTWKISDFVTLHTGWNDINLHFADSTTTLPMLDTNPISTAFLDTSLCFGGLIERNAASGSSLIPALSGEVSDVGTSTSISQVYPSLTLFLLTYKGKGESFYMNLDHLRIERDSFTYDVKFGGGACLVGYESIDIPLSSLSIHKGAVEFWFRFYTDSYGRDEFGKAFSRNLFSMSNDRKDTIALGLSTNYGIQICVGKELSTFHNVDMQSGLRVPIMPDFSIDDVVHLAMVWDNTGYTMDNHDTLRLYINNELVFVSRDRWRVSPSTYVTAKLGGSTVGGAYTGDVFGSGMFENLKIYNYCKTDFNITTSSGIDVVYEPNDFIELSEDNVTFYGIDSDQLPIRYTEVPAGEERTIYVRSNKNENFKNSRKTGILDIKWEVSV